MTPGRQMTVSPEQSLRACGGGYSPAPGTAVSATDSHYRHDVFTPRGRYISIMSGMFPAHFYHFWLLACLALSIVDQCAIGALPLPILRHRSHV